MCDFNEAYIGVTGTVNAINSNLLNLGDIPANVNYTKKVALKNSAPFFNCILKINNQLIEDAQDLDIVNPMYNLLVVPLKNLSSFIFNLNFLMINVKIELF